MLVMHGTNDVVFPMSAIDDIRDSFTNAEEVVWEPIEGESSRVRASSRWLTRFSAQADLTCSL